MSDVQKRLADAVGHRYTVDRIVGYGGMATVYRAEDLKYHRQVAIKVMRPEIAEELGVERFLREIQIEAQFQHPHILPLHDSGDADGLPYYVMPYVDGESLRDRLNREGQLPLEDALKITREVAAALGYAHGHNVIHRDIKPENILLSAGEAIVADFGTARAITVATGEQLTSAGMAVGTPEYMSPEQGAADRELDGRTDIYALGCVLYEMLAGDAPFTGPNVIAMLARKTTHPPPSVRVVRDDVPEVVDRVIKKALAKVPADRYSTPEQLVQALRQDENATQSARDAASNKPVFWRAVAKVFGSGSP